MATPRNKTHAKQSPRANTPEGETPATEEKKTSARPDEMPPEVLEFIQAIDEYKRLHRRPFPSWSEVLEIFKTLGYSRGG